MTWSISAAPARAREKEGEGKGEGVTDPDSDSLHKVCSRQDRVDAVLPCCDAAFSRDLWSSTRPNVNRPSVASLRSGPLTQAASVDVEDLTSSVKGVTASIITRGWGRRSLAARLRAPR